MGLAFSVDIIEMMYNFLTPVLNLILDLEKALTPRDSRISDDWNGSIQRIAVIGIMLTFQPPKGRVR